MERSSARTMPVRQYVIRPIIGTMAIEKQNVNHLALVEHGDGPTDLESVKHAAN